MRKEGQGNGQAPGVVMGQAIRDRRLHLNMLQGELAASLSAAIDRRKPYVQSTISEWERGRPVPKRVADTLLSILDIDPSAIGQEGASFELTETKSLEKHRLEPATIKTGADLKKSEYGKILAGAKEKQIPFEAEFDTHEGGRLTTNAISDKITLNREFSFDAQGALSVVRVEKHVGAFTQELELKRQFDGKMAIIRQAARLTRPEGGEK